MNISTENIHHALYAWMGLAVLVFLYLLKKPAPYGRHVKKGWGPEISNRWGWVLMESVVLLFFGYWMYPFIQQPAERASSVWILTIAFSLHYIHRSVVFPFFLKTKGKKMPLLIAFSAILFNAVNGNALGWTFSQADYAPEINGPFLLGCGLWLLGMAVNISHDYLLLRLRKPGQTGYVEPKGGLFSKIWTPNLWGEMLEWFGFALMGTSIATWAFFVWTLANLLPRALAHAAWYKKQFPNAPKRWI